MCEIVNWIPVGRMERIFVVCSVLLAFSTALVNSSSYAMQSHEGSAPTNEFMLNKGTPSARILIGSADHVVVINIDPPPKPENPYKVSLELLAMQLCDVKANDRLKIVYTDSSSIQTEIWQVNVTSTSPYEERKELKNIQVNQVVLIPEGRWDKSRVDIVATLYQDEIRGSCPQDTFKCSCTSRCLVLSTLCNNSPNCGLGCVQDESNAICPNSTYSSYSSVIADCDHPVSISTSSSSHSSVSSSAETKSGSGKDSGSSSSVQSTSLLTINTLFMILVSCVILK